MRLTNHSDEKTEESCVHKLRSIYCHSGNAHPNTRTKDCQSFCKGYTPLEKTLPIVLTLAMLHSFLHASAQSNKAHHGLSETKHPNPEG